MKETSFIEQNREKWNRFEELQASRTHDPEELSNLYMDITDDLSYAQTFYKRRTVRVYLNQLAQAVYSGIHRQKGESFGKFLTVWKVSLPLEIYRSRKNLSFALAAFLIYCFVGVITTHFDPDFPRIVLGDPYVDMTLDNIQKGNPLGVYQGEDQLMMFIRITTNNLKVAFITFFVGFFFTIGTHIMMFYNGVMLGAFQYFFHMKGLLITSFLGIWIHGAFEISAIVLAAGAGITAGNGWLFPGSYTRLQSLQLSTKRGLKIMMSLVPFIIAAGFLESFVTRHYSDLPEWSKWAIIILSFALIIFVYVVYPIYVARKYPDLLHQEETAPFRPAARFDLNRIRSVGTIFADSFQFYRTEFAKFSRIIFSLALPLIVLLVFLQDLNRWQDLGTQYWYDWSAQLSIMIGCDFQGTQDVVVAIIWTLVLTIIFSSVFWSFSTLGETFSWKSYWTYARKRFIGIWLGNLLLYLMIYLLPWYVLIWCFFLLPLLTLQGASMGLDRNSAGKRMRRGFSFSSRHYGKSLMVLALLTILTVIIAQPVAFVLSVHNEFNDQPLVKDLLDMFAELVKRVAREFTDDYMAISNLVRQAVYLIYLVGLIPLFAITTAFSYYSEAERSDATGLKNSFLKFGKRKRHQETAVDFE